MKRKEMIIQAIDVLTMEHGYAPSVREIAEYVGLKSASTVKGHLDRLRQAGRIDFEDDRPRTVRIVS
ncbi:transcriptional regulator [Sporolactobacillus sp. KGMB 08714]|uniref:LexA family protein n=1 Tax=Sporolactobacillus sp. KGMB 08714 TaxID=3064704 RepID=UPI002FBECC06